MKKWIIIICGSIIVLFGSCALLVSTLLPTEYVVLKENWGIDLPKADRIAYLIESPPSFNGDGEQFVLYEYSEPVDWGKVGFTALTNIQQVEHANDQIQHFTTATSNIHPQVTHIIHAFNDHNVSAKLGDYFYFDERNGGFDYIIFLYKQSSQTLYKYEWHQ